MATYKVLQDIEAEDKLLGPLTLKQFIFAIVTAGLLYLSFMVLVSPMPTPLKIISISIFLPFIIVLGFLASPIGRDQPNDVWLLAQLRFLFKPRVRIWNQDGLSDLVTVTAPKKEVHVYSNNFTQDEVRSRLKALANTVDSRGWATKNVNANMFAQPGYLATQPASDRLIDPVNLPHNPSGSDITASDDMLDTANNSEAQRLDQLMQQSSSQYRQQLMTGMASGQIGQPAQPQASQQQTTSPQDYWFLNQPQAPTTPVPQDYAMFDSQQVVSPGASGQTNAVAPTADEEALVQQAREQDQQSHTYANTHIRTLQPLHDKFGNPVPEPPQAPAVVADTPAPPIPDSQSTARQTTPNPAILKLAQNDDFDIATIARQAEKLNKPNDDGEVVISLH